MISLKFSAVELAPDTAVKQSAAQKQMVEVLDRLQSVPKYHTLTQNDRLLLKKEGYAPDLIDNLVVITERQGAVSSSHDDEIVVGFTYAAFDPALYANEQIKQHFEHVSSGCCCFCESFLASTGAGDMSHYRPVQLLEVDKDNGLNTTDQCSPYFALAYEQENLLFICPECDAKHKAGKFPVKGPRFPSVDLEEEQAMLINPYHEQPRDYIRFNPLNGHAFAFDKVCAFYQAAQQLNKEEVANLLWQQPTAIPSQRTVDDRLLTNQDIETSYQAWLAQMQPESRGEATITTLGLNRTALVLARMATLKQCRATFLEQGKDAVPPLFSEQVDTIEFRSLAIDALSTWYWQHKQAGGQATLDQQPRLSNDADAEGSHKAIDERVDEETGGVQQTDDQASNQQNRHAQGEDLPNVDKPSQEFTNLIPLEPKHGNSSTYPIWLRSCLAYLVIESELEQANKRRLVCLSSQDRFYGQKAKGKCVFLPVDWNKDTGNVIKVRSHRNIWEASFSELADSRPQELVNLFANNDVWVEGDYPALVGH
ncbi:hypothetical protein [Marinomonas mediterranea]|uniref:hypothetical protein n=1 Tax=Marinomonas mediterranea TaxID=119864 RepID=UPI002348F2BF|nr:hypothetical protein [Marinomonas mediterranea]WCN09900.1 hypothetical protein GV055_13725 [Marinomonas mediterranea]